MRIDPDDYLTITELGAKIGTNRRATMRSLARALADGHDVREKILGRTVIHRKHVPLIKKYHFPRGSEGASRIAKESGRRGGTAKAANSRLRAAYSRAIASSNGPDDVGPTENCGPTERLHPLDAAMTPPTALPDLALGSWEAAAICGVSFTYPKRMAEKRSLITKSMESAWTAAKDGVPQNEFLLYSLHDCEKNYRDYMSQLYSGSNRRRPRSQRYLDAHDPMIKLLASVEPITFDDAISTAQAAAIMGTHVTWVNTLIREGKIKARVAISKRREHAESRIYIVSRRSCEQNRDAALAAERSGKKAGPRRKKQVGVVPRVNARTPDAYGYHFLPQASSD